MPHITPTFTSSFFFFSLLAYYPLLSPRTHLYSYHTYYPLLPPLQHRIPSVPQLPSTLPLQHLLPSLTCLRTTHPLPYTPFLYFPLTVLPLPPTTLYSLPLLTIHPTQLYYPLFSPSLSGKYEDFVVDQTLTPSLAPIAKAKLTETPSGAGILVEY